MDIDFNEIFSLLEEKLRAAGFKAFSEFTAVDSLIYKNLPIGFYSLESAETVASTIEHLTLKLYMEEECNFSIRLMGKSCDYADYEDFNDKSSKLFGALAEDRRLIIRSIKMGKVYQSMPLKRLTRDISFCVRVCSVGESE